MLQTIQLMTRSSSSFQTITDLSQSLDEIIARYEAIVGASPVRSSRPTTPVLPISTSKPDIPSGHTARSTNASQPNVETPGPTASTSTPAPTPSTARRRQRRAPSLSEYLAKREREDARGGETGLLPLKAIPNKQLTATTKSSRDQLLAGQRSEGVMGNSQLHEELGGQLAEVSLFALINGNVRSVQPADMIDVTSAQTQRYTLSLLVQPVMH